MNIRSWLRRVPQPTKVRFDRKKVVLLGDGNTKWRDMMEAIELEQPVIVECLDSDGSVLRMTQLGEGDAEPPPPENVAPEVKLPPEFAMMQALVNGLGSLLLQAYVKGAEQHAKAYELAFGENTKLVTALSQQARNQQQILEQQLQYRIEQAENGDPGSMEWLAPLLPMMQGLLAKGLPAASSSNGKPNGKAKGA